MLSRHNKGISSIAAMLIAVGVVVAGVSYWLLVTNEMNDSDNNDLQKNNGDTMETDKAGDAMMEEDANEKENRNGNEMMDHGNESTTQNDSEPSDNQNQSDPPEQQPVSAVGVYIDYSAESLAAAQSEGKKPVLFFWAAWCPYCKAANEEFNANLSQIPSGVVLLKTNYDTETQLKTKYGITYQHTFVQIDANGNQVTKWSGGGINELITNIQ